MQIALQQTVPCDKSITKTREERNQAKPSSTTHPESKTESKNKIIYSIKYKIKYKYEYQAQINIRRRKFFSHPDTNKMNGHSVQIQQNMDMPKKTIFTLQRFYNQVLSNLRI